MFKRIRVIDLFCGIGGFRIGFEQACERSGVGCDTVFASDIDEYCKVAYKANFGLEPVGDITKAASNSIPDFDVMLAGFPCQPFSIIGNKLGFMDQTRGTLFFEIARILRDKMPKAFILENVKQLAGHNGGKTIKTVMSTLREIGYTCEYKVLNALDFGLPQKRERVFIVGHIGPKRYEFPKGGAPMKALEDILLPDNEIPEKYWASEYIRNKRRSAHVSEYAVSVWHENKAGHISSYPYSCALRANASYNYLLVNGERRMVPRELFRLQGFPDSYKIVVPDEQARKQAGNSIPVPVVREVSVPLVQILIEQMRKEVVSHVGDSVAKTAVCC